MAIFWKKNTTDTQEVRRCLNCGKDISNKRKNAKFCCNECWQGYHSIPETITTPPTLPSRLYWLEQQKENNNEQNDR